MSDNKKNSSITIDYIIIGAGITGITLADSLSERKAKVLVIDHKAIAAGASGTPTGLVDPAASRNARLYWDMEPCYQSVFQNLHKIQQHSDIPFFKHTGVLRPGITRSRAINYEKSYHNQQWPENWCEWKSEVEIKELCPGIQCEYGGLWHPNGITVAIPEYLNTYKDYLLNRGVTFRFPAEYELKPKVNDWIITFKNESYVAPHIIFATGASTRFSQFWDELLIYPVKGQAAVFKSSKPLPFDYAITGNGYIGHIDEYYFLMGSTYEHEFEYAEPDEWGLKQLQKMLKQTLPALFETSELVRQWSGIRASTPNRLPILGTHRFYKNVHLITGMGSKGLTYSKYTSEMLSNNLVEGKPIDHEVDIARIYKRLKKLDIID